VTELADAEVRRRIASEFGSTFFVETGKTTALVRRIVGLVSAGVATLDRLVAEKAGGETKLHLRSEIEAARQRRARRSALGSIAPSMNSNLARIGTIHAFCGDLLHERPVEAGIDPCSR
jgi:ATP-dependent exoDNAse (exonuclease V) beta subunit